MGTIIETKIEKFDGGIVNDPRDPRRNTARVVSNFDILTFPRKMSPYRQSESGDDAASTSRKRNFAVALRTGVTYSLYGLGVVSGQVYAEVLRKDISSGSELDSATWTAPTANASASGTPNFNLWVYYRRTNLIYGARDANNAATYAGTHIFAFSPSGTAFADTHQALTHTHIGQGVVHPKDDILYIPYYNNAGASGARSFIASNSAGTWTNAALTLPDHLIPTSIAPYGNFLAIGCAAANGIENSVVYLWDRNSSLTLLSESIDWGTGSLMILEEIDGELIGISQKGGTITSFGGLPNSISSHKDRVYFRRLVGNKAKKFFQLDSDRAGGVNTTSLPLYKQKVDNRLYFQMIIQFNGSARDGVWSIGRSSSEEQFALVHERTSNNNTALATGDTLVGFIFIGDFLFQAYTSSGTYSVNKTIETADTNFSANSIYESKPFDGSIHGFDNTYYKDLMEAAVMTEPIVSLGQVVLDYQVDENIGTSTWTRIFINSTNDSISHVANNVESSGAQLAKNYKEIAFRILSTGRAEITGLIFREKVTGRKYITD